MPGFRADYFDRIRGPLESSTQRVTLRLDLRNEAFLAVEGSRRHELLLDSFPIFGTVVVPPASYTWAESRFSAATHPGKPLSAEASVTTGAFWNCDRLGLTGGLSWMVNQHLSVSHSQSVNYVQLATGRFTAHIWRLRFAYSHDTRLSLEGLAQYANETRVLGTQLRLRYIVAEGTELYLVANEQFAELAGAATSVPGRRVQEALAVKATYRFAL